ncbi:MAG: hypothetical protein KBS52_07275, partial [Clostridiales bacterium]|nr:hypothetical protein [Candidatus Equinaster intestinalis]
KKKLEGVEWNENGWTTVQQANPEKHVLEINCRAENGVIVELRTRHSRGEESKGIVTVDGKEALPISIEEFSKLYEKGKIDIK